MDIRPFSFDVAEEQLTDLRRRITATRWPGYGRPMEPGFTGHAAWQLPTT